MVIEYIHLDRLLAKHFRFDRNLVWAPPWPMTIDDIVRRVEEVLARRTEGPAYSTVEVWDGVRRAVAEVIRPLPCPADRDTRLDSILSPY